MPRASIILGARTPSPLPSPSKRTRSSHLVQSPLLPGSASAKALLQHVQSEPVQVRFLLRDRHQSRPGSCPSRHSDSARPYAQGCPPHLQRTRKDHHGGQLYQYVFAVERFRGLCDKSLGCGGCGQLVKGECLCIELSTKPRRRVAPCLGPPVRSKPSPILQGSD